MPKNGHFICYEARKQPLGLYPPGGFASFRCCIHAASKRRVPFPAVCLLVSAQQVKAFVSQVHEAFLQVQAFPTAANAGDSARIWPLVRKASTPKM